MNQEDARRRLEGSTVFVVRSGRVWLRELRWVRAAADVPRGRASDAERAVAAPAGVDLEPVPVVLEGVRGALRPVGALEPSPFVLDRVGDPSRR